jgi:hypothetical protein
MDEAVKKYMSEIGKKGGSVKSEKKAKTAAENGKSGGRPPFIIRNENIVIVETKSNTSIIKGEKVKNPHVTGWHLSYTFPDGTVTTQFYQRISHTLKEAKHLFRKSCLEPRQAEYELERRRGKNG